MGEHYGSDPAKSVTRLRFEEAAVRHARPMASRQPPSSEERLFAKIMVFAHYLCGMQRDRTPQSLTIGADREINYHCSCCCMASIGLFN
jgi:hypothetical protein